jgi:hypothetical protein
MLVELVNNGLKPEQNESKNVRGGENQCKLARNFIQTPLDQLPADNESDYDWQARSYATVS